MRIEHIKVGQLYTRYEDFGAQIECVDIIPAIPGRGRRAIMQSEHGEIELKASSVIPWQEYQDQMQRAAMQKQEMDALIEKLSNFAGGGIKSINQVPHWVTIAFTEQAAARLLEILDAIPIPKKDIPSLAAKGHKVRTQKALGLRLRRAFGCGRASRLSYHEGYHASLSFTIEELAQAVTLIEGRTNQTSALADILSCN